LKVITLPTIPHGQFDPTPKNWKDIDYLRYFVGGTVLNRPSLAMLGDIVIGGFGGHCDNFNYTGMLVTVSKTSGVGVTNVVAMEASPGEQHLSSSFKHC
jgi:hypothetical protein